MSRKVLKEIQEQAADFVSVYKQGFLDGYIAATGKQVRWSTKLKKKCFESFNFRFLSHKGFASEGVLDD